MQENKPRNNSIFLLFAGTFFFFANNHVLSISIPLLITDMSLALDVIGYSTAAMGFMTILMKFLTPALIGSINLRKLILLDLIMLAAVSSSFVVVHSTASSIIVLRALFGIPFSVFPIVNLLAVTKISNGREELIRNTSIIGMAMPLSMMISPSITELVLTCFSYRTVFFLAITCSVLSLFLYMAGLGCNASVLQGTTKGTGTGMALKQGIRLLLDKEQFRKAGIPIIAFFFLGIADMLLLTYFPILASNIGRTYSFYFAVFAVAMILSQQKYSKLEWSDDRKLMVGYMLLGLSTVLSIACCHVLYFPLAALSAAFFGVGYSLTETTTNAMMMAEKENASILITVQQLSICMGRTFGPWFTSLFSGSTESFELCFILLAAVQAFPIILLLFRKKKAY